ncbi:hypothetical protein [Chlamydiifrater phoenicopteri]|uniref:hypothetical protein n=1 Tax=Chlamydiifrater phoenicopteri TaxID=2681469 RepID=UPI001BCBF58C|nr:hypothetical protein [Chlamydiifrater phoenicopteri]
MIDAIKALTGMDSEEPVSSNEEVGKPSAQEANRKDVRSFSLSKSTEMAIEKSVVDKPDLMSLIRERNSSLVDKELEEELQSAELEEQINNLKRRLNDFKLQMHDSERTEKLQAEHIEAVNTIMNLIDKDLAAIAQHSGQSLQEAEKDKDDKRSVARRVVDWISSGEEVLNRALLYFSDRNGEPESVANFMKIQYAVQRATQRAELFSSIVGTTVSSIKTIMTTQLG